MTFVYWKEEAEKRPWKFIPYKQQNMLEAIAAGAMFTTWNQFEFEPGNGAEPKRFGNLVLDFDDKQNPQNALQEVRALCLQHFPEIYDLDPNCIKFFVSGSKGFHAVVPSWVFGPSGLLNGWWVPEVSKVKNQGLS